MALTLHTLKPRPGSRTKRFRIGRGHGSGRGKTAGRGTKGQRARTGGRNKLKRLGMKQMLLTYPKVRGFQSRYDKAVSVPLVRLNALADGGLVDLAALKKAGLARRSARSAKIVGAGTLAKKLHVKGIQASAAAKAAIERAGGTYVG